MDLFHPVPENSGVCKWMIADEEIPSDRSGIFRIAHLKNGRFVEDWAYFFKDQCSDLVGHRNATIKPHIHHSHWWSTKDHKPIVEVLAWGKLCSDGEKSISIEEFLKSDEIMQLALKWKEQIDKEDRNEVTLIRTRQQFYGSK